ncbi:hypothetical protein [Kitasatospora sp. NPDC093679]|uniref:hypothetical protein n=1 Tax=Kitasatospora sp. NPDC093679 TaxID=3154983 RepID=UPI00341A67E4
MPTALQIEPNGQMEAIDLPDDPALRTRAITTRLSNSADRAVYHPQAVMWVHGNGARSLPPNLTATALASVWRGLDIGSSYFLHGRVLITAADEEADLRDDLAVQAQAVADAITNCGRSWRTAPPASNEAAWAEILGRVFTLRIGP